MAKTVFYSFHYQRDDWRVQQVIQMGRLEGQPVLNSQKWEEVKRKGDEAIQEWIDGQMAYKSTVVVLVGAETASRRWVRYEITRAWNLKKPLVGVRIHGLADRNGNTDSYGANPFEELGFTHALTGRHTLAQYVPLHTPTGLTSKQVHANIDANIANWVDNAYRRS